MACLHLIFLINKKTQVSRVEIPYSSSHSCLVEEARIEPRSQDPQKH